MFLNLVTKVSSYRRHKQSIQYIAMTARQQTQGSSRLLSTDQKLTTRKVLRKMQQSYKLRTNIFFFKTKKTHLSMSRGPIAKKKKSMITLGFKSRLHVVKNSLFGPIKNFSVRRIRTKLHLKQFSNLRTSSLSVLITKRSAFVI